MLSIWVELFQRVRDRLCGVKWALRREVNAWQVNTWSIVSEYSLYLGQLSGKSVVMRYKWVSRIYPILSFVRAIFCCRDVLFNDGQGMGTDLI